MLDAIKDLDMNIMEFFARRQYPLVSDVMESISSLGSPVNSVLFLIVVAFLDQALLADLIVPLGAAWISVYGLKFLVPRRRPEGNLETDITSSFPSGHAATAFVFAGVLAYSFPELKVVLYAVALLVAVSRIYLRTHYFSDVLTGSAIGLLFVMLL